jgi:hypothetical protein
MMDEGFEAVGIQIGEFPASFEAVLVLWVADQVEVHVFDDGHVSWAVCGAEARKVVVEDDVEHPMETVLDAPVGSHGGGESLGLELWLRRDNIGVRAR